MTHSNITLLFWFSCVCDNVCVTFRSLLSLSLRCTGDVSVVVVSPDVVVVHCVAAVVTTIRGQSNVVEDGGKHVVDGTGRDNQVVFRDRDGTKSQNRLNVAKDQK